MDGPGRRKRDPRVIAALVASVLLASTAFAFIVPGQGTTTRTVDVAIYDLFNAPAGGFPDYWTVRSNTYRRETILSSEFPYLFRYTPKPSTDPGNFFLYGNYRMSVTGRALPEMSIDAPVILPSLGREATSGGSAAVDFTMQFLTRARWDALRSAHPEMPTWNFNDGWVAELRGTVTMDALGAAKVLGVKGDPLAWWASNELAVEDAWSTWLDTEGNVRLDIYSGFRAPFAELFTDLTLTTSGGMIVLGVEHVSWGIDALLARWMYWGRATYPNDVPAGFLGFEGRYDRMSFRATLTGTADVDITTEVDYGLRAWVASGSAGAGDRPAWVWQPSLFDVLASRSEINPLSEFDPYVARTYVHYTPGSPYYGRALGYEYTPAAWNLKAGETLTFLLGLVHPVVFFVPPQGAPATGTLRPEASRPAGVASYEPVSKVLRFVGPLATGAPSPPDVGVPWVELELLVAGGTSRRRL